LGVRDFHFAIVPGRSCTRADEGASGGRHDLNRLKALYPGGEGILGLHELGSPDRFSILCLICPDFHPMATSSTRITMGAKAKENSFLQHGFTRSPLIPTRSNPFEEKPESLSLKSSLSWRPKKQMVSSFCWAAPHSVACRLKFSRYATEAHSPI
jgi:hypothetical protein